MKRFYSFKKATITHIINPFLYLKVKYSFTLITIFTNKELYAFKLEVKHSIFVLNESPTKK